MNRIVRAALLVSLPGVCMAASLESAKTDSGLKFLESKSEQAGKQEPAPVLGKDSALSASKLAASLMAAPKGEARLVPAPTADYKEAIKSPEDPQLQSNLKLASKGMAVLGGIAGAVVGLPAIGSGMPLLIAFPVAGVIIVAGAAIGYGSVALGQWVAESWMDRTTK